MSTNDKQAQVGEHLIKQDLITREELAQAKENEAQTGLPWYMGFIQAGRVSYAAIEDTLRYEVHLFGTERQEHDNLGKTLVSMGALSEDQLQKALTEQKRTGRLLGKVLIEKEYVTNENMAKALARQYNLIYAPLKVHPSSREALESVPESLALKNQIVPISVEGDKITVLITDPQVQHRLGNLAILLGKRISPLLTESHDLKAELKKRYKSIQDNSTNGSSATAPAAAKTKVTAASPAEKPSKKKAEGKQVATTTQPTHSPQDRESARFEQIRREASGTSVVKMVSTIIEGAVNSGATDIHLDPQDPETRVRYRIDGVLHDVMSIPRTMQQAVISRIKIMSDLDITDTRHPQDGHISMDVGEHEFDIRVASLPTFLGERIVLRLLDQSSVLSGIRDLGLEEDDEATLSRLIDQPYGMILVTGPTGSGKTTTLYAALNQKNVMTDSIVTLEDPVEYQLSGINQVQIDNDIELTFANTLRAALRQDIDVLLVGEIRDSETARIAIRAAMTGHLVFSTLHTNDAPEAVSTLRNMGVPSYLIASALTAIVGQRLVRTICDDCRTSFKPSAALLKSLSLPATTKKLYRGRGCPACYNTGNRGRTGVFEVFEVTNEIRRLIGQDEPVEKLVKAAKLKTMAERSRRKVIEGVVTPEEFLRVIRT